MVDGNPMALPGILRPLCAAEEDASTVDTSPLLTDPYEFEAARGHIRNNPTGCTEGPHPTSATCEAESSNTTRSNMHGYR